MPDKTLIIVGQGEELKKLQTQASQSIQFITDADDQQLRHYLRQARAFVFASQEDFGILPLEAQACGTPVIAYGKGGALETVCAYPNPEPSGLFFYEQNSQAIQDAIQTFESHEALFKPEFCIQQAAQFCPATFREKIKALCEQAVQAH